MPTNKNLPVTIDEALSYGQVLSYLADPASVEILNYKENPDEIRNRIESQLLAATSIEELLGERELLQGKQFVNKPFQVRSVQWRLSDFDGEGLPFYAVCEIVTPDGTMHALSCGARSVVQKLAIMVSNDWLPAWVRITEGKATDAGYKPLDLGSAPDGF